MSEDPKQHALTLYASMYLPISRMTNYYSQATATTKKVLHESVDDTIHALKPNEKANAKLISFYEKVKTHIDEICMI